MHLRCGGIFNDHFLTRLLLSPLVKEFCKSVNKIWLSYVLFSLTHWVYASVLCVCQVVARYTEVTGVDWDDDDRCSTCSSSSSDSEFDYYLDRRLRPAQSPAAALTQQPAARMRHVGEDFVYASGNVGIGDSGRPAFYSPAHCVRSPSAGWARDGRRADRRRKKKTGKRCIVS